MKTGETKKLDGPRAMMEWDKTWKAGDFPSWLRKNGAAYLRRIQPHHLHHRPEIGLPTRFLSLLDHFGSVAGEDDIRSFITQPYHDHDIAAHRFAAGLRITLVRSIAPAPWAPLAVLYEFRPGDPADYPPEFGQRHAVCPPGLIPEIEAFAFMGWKNAMSSHIKLRRHWRGCRVNGYRAMRWYWVDELEKLK